MDINFFRQFKKIDIIGHANADFDSCLSCYLIKEVLTRHCIDAEVILPDGLDDPFFAEKAREFGFEYDYSTRFRDDSVLILTDHAASYPKRIIACFDHHPNAVPEALPPMDFYLNTDKTCCGLLIYQLFEKLGEVFSDTLTKLTICGCYIDSLSFKSSKALPADHSWCKMQLSKYHMDESEMIHFGYGLTDRGLPFQEYVRTGTKIYETGQHHFGASYIIVEDTHDDLAQIASELKQNLNDDVIAWCFIIGNVAENCTTVMLITDETVLIRSVPKMLSRGKDIVPAVREFLSKNGGDTNE